MAYQIFISYRREGGGALSYLIYQKFLEIGYQVFYDIESLSGGKFNEKIYDIIDTVDNVIVVLSMNALDRCENEGDWVRNEIAYSLKQGKNIIPVVSPDFIWPERLPDDIKEIKRYNGVRVNFMYFDGVIQRIEKYIETNNRKEMNDNSRCSGLKHILTWSDFDHGILAKIIKRLDLNESFYIEELTEPVEILSKDLDSIYAILLFDTDVTKLSNSNDIIERINEALMSFVEHGGKLIATHDLIYRRTRNYKLQEMFGCKINRFQEKKK